MPIATTYAVRVAAIAVCLLGASDVLAQQPTTGGGQLEEIIVTAQKREQSAQEIGISLSAATGQELLSMGAATATDLTRFMPAVVLTQPNGPSSYSLAIRGVTQNDFADHQESPAAIYVDDVYVSQMAGLTFSLFDVDRVEVLRGPQGTLFGRNATGGLANYVTNRPTDVDGGYTDITVGERNLERIEGAVNGRLWDIWDGVDGRLSFVSNHYDPLFTNVAGGAANAENGNDYAVRGQLLFKLPNAAQLLVNARGSRQNANAGSWEEYAAYTPPGSNGANNFVPGNMNPYGTCNGCNGSGLPNSGPFTIRDNISGYAKLKFYGFTSKYTQDLSFATLNVIGDYSSFQKDYQEDSDASPYTIFEFFNGSKVNQQSLEIRLNGNVDKFNWTAGLYGLRISGSYYEGWIGPAFFTAAQFQSPFNPNNGYYGAGSNLGPWPYGSPPFWSTISPATGTNGVPGPDGGIPTTKSPYDLLTKSYAGFGQLEYRATDLIGLTLGMRVTEDKKDYNFTWFPYEMYPTNVTDPIKYLTPPTGLTLYSYNNSRSDTLWSGKAQVDFHLTPDQLAYASYNRGVKGGGFTAPLFPFTISELSTLTFKPETLTSYEVGYKSEWLNHTLRFNAAAYYYDYQNYQALIYPVGLEQLVVNADARHKGAEAELDWAPTQAWQFGAGVAYVDAIVVNVPARCCYPSGAAVVGDYTPPNAPRWTANAMARYTIPIGENKLSLQADGNYMTSFWFNLSDNPDVKQNDFGLFNFRTNYTTMGGRLQVGTSVENVANKHYGLMGFDNVSINGLAQVYPGMPRWWKAHLIYKF